MAIASYTLPTDSGVTPTPTAGGSGGTLALISDHCDQALSRLLAQYQESPRLRALICAFVDRVQELETAVYDVHTKTLSIDSAEGVQLDLVGKIVGESRNGRTDSAYRLSLRVRILVNISDGTAPELIEIARLFEDLDSVPGSYVSVQEVQPARLEVRIVSTPVNAYAETDKRLRQAKAGGVALTTILHPGSVGGSFRFVDVSDYPEKNTAEGFASSVGGHGVTGGDFAFVLGS